MAYDLSKLLVVGISSRALFDLSREDQIYRERGLQAYAKYQYQHENDVLKPGTGFPLVKAMLSLNQDIPSDRRVEVLVLSRNSPNTGLRVLNAIDHYGLDITRSCFTGGKPAVAYAPDYCVDLFLSADEEDVRAAHDNNIPAAIVYAPPGSPPPTADKNLSRIRIAFDGDAVLFDEESERIFQESGVEEFKQHELEKTREPLKKGPFAKLLVTLSYLQRKKPPGKSPIRIGLFTSRNSPSHKRVIHTLRAWKVRVDELHFMGGVEKAAILRRFEPHIYFDDQHTHCDSASHVVPTARVPSDLSTSDARIKMAG
ncbi:MAG: 5'-nucleotidase [Phycisphaerales bacterium]